MKTRMLARAAESERVEDRCAHACGLVSRTMASSDGGGAAKVSCHCASRAVVVPCLLLS